MNPSALQSGWPISNSLKSTSRITLTRSLTLMMPSSLLSPFSKSPGNVERRDSIGIKVNRAAGRALAKRDAELDFID